MFSVAVASSARNVTVWARYSLPIRFLSCVSATETSSAAAVSSVRVSVKVTWSSTAVNDSWSAAMVTAGSGSVGVTGPASPASPASPAAFTARSSKVWATPLVSIVTVNESSFASSGALFGIGVQSSG